MSWLFTSGGQSIGASVLVLPMNIPLGWTGWISLQSKGLSRLFSNTTVSKASILLALSLPYGPTLTSICDYWRLGVISVKKKKKKTNLSCCSVS